ncbi:MAG TPA: carboxylate-amine ligase [Chloroflexi bacterium]|nr:carboxylate-amine ligase [Chloroflexota bacterium]
MLRSTPLTIGIEEEYQIIDPETRELTSYVQQFLNEGRVLGDQIKQEFLQSQVEVGSRICRSVKEAREEIRRLRSTLCAIADKAGLKLAAAGTHPFSHWADQVISDSERYLEFAEDMQHVVRSLLIFGMHVHVGFGDSPSQRELMITVMNQARYFVPHILALSTSSPFWMGHNTGLKSYRSIVFKALPRTGLPMEFRSWSEYENFIQTLSRVGALGRDVHGLADATRIWWDIRPHPRYNTLEFRIADLTTTLDETICIAALFQAVVAKLIKLRENNLSWRIYRRDLINENKWRAVRYGVKGQLIDFGKETEVPLPDLIDELVELLDDVVDDLDSRSEVEYARVIAREGSSADRQLRVYHEALTQGASEREALIAVVDHLIEETQSGL